MQKEQIIQSHELLASSATLPSNISFLDKDVFYCLNIPTSTDKKNSLCAANLSSNRFQVVLQSLEESVRALSKEEILLRERTRATGAGITSFTLDASSRQILLPSGPNLYLYNIDRGTLLNLYSREGAFESIVKDEAKMDAKFSPDAKIISFVAKGDLYVKHVETGREERLTFAQDKSEHTTAGVSEFIIQEEFDRYTGYWWSPVVTTNGTYRIAYLEVDESNVPVVSIPSSGSFDGTADEYRYPRPGEQNAKSTLRIVEFDQSLHIVANYSYPELFTGLFPWAEYIMRCGWTPCGQRVWLWVIDRKQQNSLLFTVDTLSRHIEIVAEDRSDIWVNTKQTIHFLKNSNHVIFGQETTGYNHLYLYERDPNGTKYKLVRAITAGEWLVNFDDMWVDEPNQLVYFVGTVDSPIEPHLYSVSIYGDAANANLKRLTTEGFSVARVAFNTDFSAFVAISSSVSTRFVLESFSIRSGETTQKTGTIAYPERQVTVSFETVQPRLYSFRNNTGEICYGCLYLPPNYDASKQYPCILHIYAGPHVQTVKNSYAMRLHGRCQLMASLGFVVVQQDGRGSFNRGLAFEGYLRNSMGQFEIDDHITGIRSLVSGQNMENMKVSIDLKRVGIFGWSYGGYASLLALAHYPDFFKVAVSGAPVTDWALYDTGYTERYMDTPQNNPEGYKKGSILTNAFKFPDDEDRLLIIHGLSDENVHFKHTECLISAFIKQQKPYQLAVYPGERHGVRSLDGIVHSSSRLLNFFSKNL